MWRTLGIEELDWLHTPFVVQMRLVSLSHETHSLALRTRAYQQQIAEAPRLSAQIQQLNRQKGKDHD